jgi:RNA polymerase sigma-70 factor (sigma-E family)
VKSEDVHTSRSSLRAAFDLHYGALLRLCLALGEPRGDAEDIVQEAFVRVASSIDRVEPAALRSYLRRTVMNIRHDRRSRLAKVGFLGGRNVSDHVDGVGERDAMWTALGRLPARQRACLVLRYYEDLPEREVAELLGCSVGTVKSQSYRGLARLREEVER